ncbi:MAG: 30S ribosomal protein S16 [Fluviicola sp.]|nr:30S ribosomal protein S16 [Fluviicola sp.]
MATRIRLQRHGKKGNAIFHVVVADSRAKRDGKFIEKLGTYNPNTNPATISINFESAVKWVGTGAELTETARAILSYKGVLYKNHLLKGVTKGALTVEQAEAKFAAWEAEKAAKIEGKIDGLGKNAAADKAARMQAEADANAAKAKAIEVKNTPAVEDAPVEEVEAATEETATEEATEAPAAEEATEAPATEEGEA